MKFPGLSALLLLGILFEHRFPVWGAVPDSLDMTEFRSIMVGFSEGPGDFPGDNFISNESSYLHVMPTVVEKTKPGGVYIGVGTEQNYSYVCATRPDIAFIVDIRRENLLQHLLYKALFALSPNRTAFMQLLFSRQDRNGKTNPNAFPDESSSVSEVVDHIDRATVRSEALFELNWKRIRREVSHYGIEDRSDLDRMRFIYRSFYEKQLEIRYADTTLVNGVSYPTFRDLITGTTLEGEFASFLSTATKFNYVRDLHRRNLIIPVVGDFAGMKTFRAIASYVAVHDTSVSVLYVSNVEYFLINQIYYVFEWYVANVEALPIDEHSLLIRSYLGMESHPKRVGRHMSTSTVHHIRTFLERFHHGAYTRSRPVWWRFWPWDRPYWSGGEHSYYHLVTLGDLAP